MCHTTKDLIVATLRELMKDQPLRKIKVQDVMKATGMTRQSFYYHFQDIYQVIEWEVNRKLFQRVRDLPDMSYFQWYRYCLVQLDKDLDFYRRVLKNLDEDCVERTCLPMILPHVYQFLFDTDEVDHTVIEEYTAAMMAEMIFHQLVAHCKRRTPLTEEEMSARLFAMDNMLLGMKNSLLTAQR